MHHAEYLYTILSETFTLEPVQKYINRLSETFPSSNILVSGYQLLVHDVQLPENVRQLNDLKSTIEFLESMLTGQKVLK